MLVNSNDARDFYSDYISKKTTELETEKAKYNAWRDSYAKKSWLKKLFCEYDPDAVDYFCVSSLMSIISDAQEELDKVNYTQQPVHFINQRYIRLFLEYRKQKDLL